MLIIQNKHGNSVLLAKLWFSYRHVMLPWPVLKRESIYDSQNCGSQPEETSTRIKSTC